MALSNDKTSLIFTDPPYHDDVRYGDLSALFRAWTNSELNLRFEAVASQNSNCNYRQQLTTTFGECKRVLKPEGHLVISFANRDPDAWTDLFQSLIDSGFESCGFGLVHSENETDHSKRGTKSCTMDLVLDLVHSENQPNKWDGSIEPKTEQEQYLNLIGSPFIKYVKPGVDENWEEDFMDTIEGCDFISR
jgi:adenine-specific DNA methylase